MTRRGRTPGALAAFVVLTMFFASPALAFAPPPASSGPTTSAPPSPATSTTAAPATSTTARSSPPSSAASPPPSSSGTAQPPPDTIPADPNNLAQQVSEVPPAEAQLIGLLDTVRARLANLTVQLQALDKDIADNQTALQQANALLAARQAASAAAGQRVKDLAVTIAAARNELRIRAVAAYVLPPTGELANLIVHVRDLSQLNEIRGFYDAVLDVQVRAVKRLDRLRKDAVTAARQATAARDLAQRQQQSVLAQQTTLNAIKATFVQVQRESQDQEAQQTQLLSQADAEKAAFQQAVQEQQRLSDQIAALLRNLESSGGPAIPASSGYFGIPIPGAPITSPFGPRIDPVAGLLGFHPGVDFGATFGTPIEAAGDGTVVWAGPDGGYGNCTIIDHGHSMATLYAHQSLILVHVGDQVSHGQVIGEVGSTGYSTGPHLHFEVRVNGSPVDPVPYL